MIYSIDSMKGIMISEHDKDPQTPKAKKIKHKAQSQREPKEVL
jgi:hypothetical protein